MDLELEGRVYIVTGASAGIGEATAALLAREGAQVVGVARSPVDVAADLTRPDAAQHVVTSRWNGTDAWTASSTTRAPSNPGSGSSTSPTPSGTRRSS